MADDKPNPMPAPTTASADAGPTANPVDLVGEKIFIRSVAKIGRVISQSGNDVVVRLSPDAADLTAPTHATTLDDIVRNVAGG